MGEIKSVLALEPLIKLLSNENSEIRKVSIAALGEIKSVLALEPLIKLLSNENSEITKASIAALGKIRSEKIVEPIIEIIDNQDKMTKIKCIEILSKIKSTKAVTKLVEVLSNKDENSEVRSWAAFALGEIGDEKAVQPLANALMNENVMIVKNRSFWSLKKINTPEALETLKEYKKRKLE